MNKNDVYIVRELAKKAAEAAASPRNDERRALWRKLNGLAPERPMVMIDQVCWNEMNYENELTLICEDEEARAWEWRLRKLLYQWKHFPVDMAVDNFIRVYKAISGLGFGIGVQTSEELKTDDTNDVISHAYENQIQTYADLEKIKMPVVSHDAAETKRRAGVASELFGGIFEIYENGAEPYLSLWDPIATWMGAEGVLYGLADDPELMGALAKRVADGYMSMLDQLEAQNLLCGRQSLIHCTGAWTDGLLWNGRENVKCKDMWMFGLAQVFSTVSPAMFDEYEIEYSLPLFKRFGLVYYGCCDPLDGKMKEVRRIPGLRKVSMSPWANKAKGAEEIGRGYVYSCKPNPAFLAMPSFDEDVVRNDLLETKKLCAKYGCPLEIILKDISTVKYEPQRLWRWAEIAMEVVEGL